MFSTRLCFCFLIGTLEKSQAFFGGGGCLNTLLLSMLYLISYNKLVITTVNFRELENSLWSSQPTDPTIFPFSPSVMPSLCLNSTVLITITHVHKPSSPLVLSHFLVCSGKTLVKFNSPTNRCFNLYR